MSSEIWMKYINGQINEETVIRAFDLHGFPGHHSEKPTVMNQSERSSTISEKQSQDAKSHVYQEGENVLISGLPGRIDSFDEKKGKYRVDVYEVKKSTIEAEPSRIQYPLYREGEVVFCLYSMARFERVQVKKIITKKYVVSMDDSEPKILRTAFYNRIGEREYKDGQLIPKKIGGSFEVGDEVAYKSRRYHEWFRATVERVERTYHTYQVVVKRTKYEKFVHASKLWKQRSFYILQDEDENESM